MLPVAVEADVWLIPISGGADSSALAILLHEMFPEVPWRLVFTDTGAEEPEICESLKWLEVYLGKKIDWVLPERSMWQLLADYGNYLPSSQARWCTHMTKAEPFKIYLEQFADQRNSSMLVCAQMKVPAWLSRWTTPPLGRRSSISTGSIYSGIGHDDRQGPAARRRGTPHPRQATVPCRRRTGGRQAEHQRKKNAGISVHSIHPSTSKDGHTKGRGFYGGEVISYLPAVTLKDAYFNVH
ncbi:MAG: phosphoadenosine phosphosulfate reductase family protein [Novosphingobium sp.]